MLESIETKGKNPWDYVETVEEQDTSMNYGPYQDFIATGKGQKLTSLLHFLDCFLHWVMTSILYSAPHYLLFSYCS